MHALGEVKRYLYNLDSERFLNLLEYLDDIIGLRTFDDGYDASLAPMSILV